jgi:hypothetical protein
MKRAPNDCRHNEGPYKGFASVTWIVENPDKPNRKQRRANGWEGDISRRLDAVNNKGRIL